MKNWNKCISFELPNDERVGDIESILDKWRIDYYKEYLHDFILSYRVKFILFSPCDNFISELCKDINTRYNKDDCVRQSKFELSQDEYDVLVNIIIK